jgi:hypothetical protein
MSVYQFDDFKRLSWLAKELATLKSDDPDLATTLKKCVMAGVSLAIFQHTPINVWRLSENRRTGNSKSEHVALPISDRGDLEEYEGVLFLTSSCIDALLNAGGEKIRCNEFGGGSSQKYAKAHDELILASERQVARSMVDEFLAQETRQQRKQKKAALVQTVFPDDGFEECSTEAWLEFRINDVLVLKKDLVKILPASDLSLPEEQALDLKGNPKAQHEWMRDYEAQHQIDTSKPLPDEVIQAYEAAAIKVGMTKNIFRDRCRERDPKVRGIDRRTLKK